MKSLISPNSDLFLSPNLAGSNIREAMLDAKAEMKDRERRHQKYLAEARAEISRHVFLNDGAFNEFIARKLPRDAHYLWLAYLDRPEYESIVAQGLQYFVEPHAGNFAIAFDTERADRSAEHAALSMRLAVSGPEPSPKMIESSEAAFGAGEAIIRVVLLILESQNIEAAVWALALHSGAAERLGVTSQLEVAERIGESKQALNAHVRRFAFVLGTISKRFHTTPCRESKRQVAEKHWRRSRTVLDALR